MTDLAALLARIRALEQAATPGKWFASTSEDTSSSVYLDTDADGFHSIANTPIPFHLWCTKAGETCLERRNFAFIAALRNLAPKMLAVIEAAADVISHGMGEWCDLCGHGEGTHDETCDWDRLCKGLAAIAKEAADECDCIAYEEDPPDG